MNKRFSLLAAGIAALFFSACGDDVVESYPPETPEPPSTAVQATAKLNVIVQNGSDKTLVSDATVTLLSTGEEERTSTTGAVWFNGVDVGQHGVRVEKSGFASIVAVGRINATQSENIYQITVQLYPTEASLEGYLRYKDKNGYLKPAEGAPLLLVLNSSDLEKSQIPATAGTGGKYKFENLPAVGEDITYTIYAQEITFGSITYPTQVVNQSSKSSKALLPGVTAYYGYAQYSENTSVFDLLGYTDKINGASEVVFEFSDAIEEEKFSTSLIAITPVLDFTVAVEGNKLVLTPRWVIDPAYPYSRSFKVSIDGLTSVSGKSFSTNNNLEVNLLLDNPVFELISYTNRINDNNDVVFTFNDYIETTKFRTDLITIEPVLEYTPLVSGKTLTLRPKDGKWSNNPNYNSTGQFLVSIKNLTSTKGETKSVLNKEVSLIMNNTVFELLDYTARIADNADVVFTFSDVIDTKFNKENVVVKPSSGDALSYETVVADQTVTLKPKGKWSAHPNYNTTKSFTVSISNLVSVKGKTITKIDTTINLIYDYTPFTLLPDFKSFLETNTDAVVFTFSDAIDAKRFSNSIISIIPDQLADVTVKDSSIIIVPPEKWADDFTVNFSNNIYSVKGDSVKPNSISITLPVVDLSPLIVDILTATDDNLIDAAAQDNSVHLTWTKVEGATSYEIYARKSSAYAQDWGNWNSTGISVSNDFGDYITGTVGFHNWEFSDGKGVEFVVQASNSKTKTLLTKTLLNDESRVTVFATP